MDAKMIKRILYGLVAAAFFFIAGQQVTQVGFSAQAVAAGGAGLLLGFMALTGKG